jgi:hypothetical protein
MMAGMAYMEFGPGRDEQYEARRDELVDDFAAWAAPLKLDIDPSDLGLLLDWKRNYGDGRLDRWRRGDLSEFLIDWCPRKLSATAEEARSLPSTVTLAMSFLAARGLLDPASEPVEQLTEHAIGLQADFMAEMDDPANFGMAKSLFASMNLDAATMTQADLDRVVREFNERPERERRQLTDQAMPEIAVGPIVRPSTEEVRASALASPVLTTFIALADYCATPGRPLTKAGNLKLADAKTLVELLGTPDAFRTTHDEWRGPTRSSTNLIHLDHWQWWARECGVLRSRNNRLVAVQTWRHRASSNPVEMVTRAFDVLESRGVLNSFRWWFADEVTSLLDASVGPLLGRLISGLEQGEYDALLESWTAMADALGVVPGYPEQVRSCFSDLVMLLERSGVIIHSDVETVPTRHGGSTRSGGHLELTPVGVAVAVELLQKQGVAVEVLGDPTDDPADRLVALADRIDAAEWWSLVERWLVARPHPERAARELLVALDSSNPAVIVFELDQIPEPLVDMVAPALTELAEAPDAPGDLAAIAYGWLARTGRLPASQMDENRRMYAELVRVGRIAAGVPDLLIEALDIGPSAQNPYELIATISRSMPPRAVDLLAALGERHPDKRVAKAARKELFRVRSRLVQRSR